MPGMDVADMEMPRESRSGSFASAITLVGESSPQKAMASEDDLRKSHPALQRHVSTVQEETGGNFDETRLQGVVEKEARENACLSPAPSDDAITLAPGMGGVAGGSQESLARSTTPVDGAMPETKDEIALAKLATGGPDPSCATAPQNIAPQNGLPALPFDLWSRRWRIVLGVGLLFFFDVAVPLILYYVLQYRTGLDDQDVLGYACLSVGIGELLELPIRAWRLWRRPKTYNGIGCDNRWAFDFLFWWYMIATVIGIVPYAVATSLPSGKPLYKVFLMVPGMVVGFASLVCLASLLPRGRHTRIGAHDYGFRSPVRLSSDPRGTAMKPFVFYVIEDFMAVDCRQGRPWRAACHARYAASEPFRKLMWDLTMFWGVGGCVFTGVLAAFTWATPFSFAYGASFVWLFLWMMLWVGLSLPLVAHSLRAERLWFKEQQLTA